MFMWQPAAFVWFSHFSTPPIQLFSVSLAPIRFSFLVRWSNFSVFQLIVKITQTNYFRRHPREQIKGKVNQNRIVQRKEIPMKFLQLIGKCCFEWHCLSKKRRKISTKITCTLLLYLRVLRKISHFCCPPIHSDHWNELTWKIASHFISWFKLMWNITTIKWN